MISEMANGPDAARLRPKLRVRLAAPRGFCAGVERAVQIVEEALKRHGAPVYVRHEIVHNKFVVSELERKGAVFVKELHEAPGDRPIIFSAHGVPKVVPAEAERRNMTYIDATCPLVSKVHIEARRHFDNGYEIILIGHAGHPEVIGTMGQLDDGAVKLVETIDDVEQLTPKNPDRLAYVTQTTLSVDDTIGIVTALKARFPNIAGPRKDDICYATSNRQAAVKAIASNCDCFIVIGAPNSSNSMRLVEVARLHGAKNAWLVERAERFDWDAFGTPKVIGMTAGASAPETLVDEMLSALNKRFEISVEEVTLTEEDVSFKLPRALAV